jgi:DDE superfamily endonuclease
MWVIPTITIEFIERMLDVLEVLERPFNPLFPVVCLDEKSKQLLKEVRQFLGIRPGKPKRVDYEYERNGTANVFVAIEPKAGKRIARVTRFRKKWDFAFFIKFLVDYVYPTAEKIVLILDNLNTHSKKALIDIFGETEGGRLAQRIEWHHTPKHASWLDPAEIEIHCLETICLKKRIGTLDDMREEVAAYVKERNDYHCGINWQFTRKRAIEKFHLN